MAQGITRKNHYVPQNYLGYFSTSRKGEDPGVWVYDRDGSTPRKQTALATTAKRDLYTFIKPDGEKDTSLESDLFTRTEGLAWPIFDRWIRKPGIPFVKSDMSFVLLYMTLQHLRVPRNINAAKEFEDKYAEEWLKRLSHEPAELDRMWKLVDEISKGKNERNPWASKDEFAKCLHSLDKHFQFNSNPKDALMMGLRQTGLIHGLMEKLIPRILIAPIGNFFITSDSPVNVMVRTGTNSAIFGGGFGHENIQIFFPFSPQCAVFLSTSGAPGCYRIRSHDVDEYNKRCVMQSDRWVISPYESHRVARYVKKFASHRGGELIDRHDIAEKIDKSFASDKAVAENEGS